MLPGSLLFPYGTRFFCCNVNVTVGRKAQSSRDPHLTFPRFVFGLGVHHMFFTDGSRQDSGDPANPCKVGFSVVSEDPETVFYARLSEFSTIFDAKPSGVLYAL